MPKWSTKKLIMVAAVLGVVCYTAIWQVQKKSIVATSKTASGAEPAITPPQTNSQRTTRDDISATETSTTLAKLPVLSKENCDVDRFAEDVYSVFSKKRPVATNNKQTYTEQNIAVYDSYSRQTIETLSEQGDAIASLKVALRLQQELLSSMINDADAEKRAELYRKWRLSQQFLEKSLEEGFDGASRYLFESYLLCYRREFCDAGDTSKADREKALIKWKIINDSRSIFVNEAVRFISGLETSYPKFHISEHDLRSTSKDGLLKELESSLMSLNKKRRQKGLPDFRLGIQRIGDYETDIQNVIRANCRNG